MYMKFITIIWHTLILKNVSYHYHHHHPNKGPIARKGNKGPSEDIRREKDRSFPTNIRTGGIMSK